MSSPFVHAMALQHQPGVLGECTLPLPEPGEGEILLRVHACGVCRTDLHIVDGELKAPALPLVPGHEIVGIVAARGAKANRFAMGERVGVGWLGGACGHCDFCNSGRENLCAAARFTGFHRNGGYATYALVDEQFCFAIPDRYDDITAAPLLCAGFIGYRALTAAGTGKALGIYGLGAAGHLVTQIAAHQGRRVYAFTRSGDLDAQELARRSGACWAGASGEAPPEPLSAAIIFAPAGELVPEALARVGPGGVVVCAGIHMSDIPSFPYSLLWGERTVRSVANLTRADGDAFMRIAAEIPLEVFTTLYKLSDANTALADLRKGSFVGAAVLVD